MSRSDDIAAWDAIWEQSRIGPAYELSRARAKRSYERNLAITKQNAKARWNAGLCAMCREPRFLRGFCFYHLVCFRLSMAGLVAGKLKYVSKKRRVARYLDHRYRSVLAGHPPLSEHGALAESFRIRKGFDIRWGGAKGVITFAAVIMYFERKGLEKRNAPL